ncbi:hypothetical protein ACN2XU_23535 [Primorskyibacter sp. 2E107]|uniref:hypothetical protein n=1 Tax=Primorskyibacter sp. 2E107 TaxID=3403458 RepID=UPI003AF972C4
MNERAILSLTQMDQMSLFHPVSSISDLQKNGPSIFTAAERVTVTRDTGQTLLDMGAGLWCVNVGYGRKGLVQAGAVAMQELSFQHFFGGASAEPTIRLADRLLGLFLDTVPGSDMARVFSATPDRTPMTPPSNWSTTTTTCAASRRRKRSSRGRGPITV